MYRPKLTIAEMWEAALVVVTIGAGVFLLSGMSGARTTEPMRERIPQHACMTAAAADPACASPFASPSLYEGRAAGHGPVDGLDATPPRR